MPNRIIIVGVPNSGKSALFNHLQSKFSMTGNYAYTTTAMVKSRVTTAGGVCEIIDTPGINSLAAFSEDEIRVRNALLESERDIIVQCVDASAMQRSLQLTAQLMELGLPLIIALNFVDEARSRGIWVDRRKMESLLKIPVVEIIASQGRGVGELIKRFSHAHKSTGNINYQKTIQNHTGKLKEFLSDSPPPGLLLLLLSQPGADIFRLVRENYGNDAIDKVKPYINRIDDSQRQHINQIILEDRTDWVQTTAMEISTRSRVTTGGISETIGMLVRHPVFGWPILGMVLAATYLLVGKVGAVYMAGGLDEWIFSPLAGAIGNSVPWPFLRDFLVGEYGILTLGVFCALGTVLPILSMFFIVLAFLEDVGYIPNLCILTNRLLRKIGLGGKSVLPLALGFGCKTMATLTTSVVDSWKEKYITIFMIAFAIPCSAELGLNLAILAYFPFSATLIVVGVLILVEIAAGAVLNKVIPKDRPSDFILEVPPIIMPNFGSLILKVYYRMADFLKEAVPLFLFGAVALFGMDKLGILTLIKNLMSPIVENFLSLPIKCLDGFMLCLVRHEQGAAILLDLAKEGHFSYISVIVCVVVITGFVPCIPNIAAMGKRLGAVHAIVMTLTITTAAILTGGLVNWILR